MRLSTGVLSILQKVLLISVCAIMIVTFTQLALIGKNITYSTRFTPLESEQNHLRNETYITQAQAIIILLCIAYVFILPFGMYSAIKLSKRIFLPVLLLIIGLNGLLVFLNIFFLTGARQYRHYMNQQYSNIVQSSGMCESGQAPLCTIGTCVRLQVFHQARSMAISFTVISSLFTIVFTVISILVNKRRKDSEKMQLIV